MMASAVPSFSFHYNGTLIVTLANGEEYERLSPDRVHDFLHFSQEDHDSELENYYFRINTAQLLHYGLPWTNDKEMAITILRRAIDWNTLEQPEYLRQLEASLRTAWEATNAAHNPQPAPQEAPGRVPEPASEPTFRPALGRRIRAPERPEFTYLEVYYINRLLSRLINDPATPSTRFLGVLTRLSELHMTHRIHAKTRLMSYASRLKYKSSKLVRARARSLECRWKFEMARASKKMNDESNRVWRAAQEQKAADCARLADVHDNGREINPAHRPLFTLDPEEYAAIQFPELTNIAGLSYADVLREIGQPVYKQEQSPALTVKLEPEEPTSAPQVLPDGKSEEGQPRYKVEQSPTPPAAREPADWWTLPADVLLANDLGLNSRSPSPHQNGELDFSGLYPKDATPDWA